MEAVREPGAVILDEIAQLETERAQTEAKIARRMLAFADLRRRRSELAATPAIGKLEASFAADELALVLKQPTRTVQCRLAEARRARGLLPRTWLAFNRGEIDGFRVKLVSSCADKLAHAQSLIALDDKVGAYAGSHTAAQTKAWLRRFAARVEPEGQERRSKHEWSRRSVWFDHDPDGVSWVHAMLATTDAIRLDGLLTGLGKKVRDTADATLEQARADVFADLVLGRRDLSGAPTGRVHGGATIAITVPVTTLAGLDDQPGESFDGQFALPADLVRDLAAEPGTLFYRLMTDPLGHILDVTEIGRYPSRKLKTAIQFRDGTCAFWTCSRPATECDNDHVIPSPRGPTVGHNLRALCRRHHRMKTFGIAATDFGAAGHRWHMPDGYVVDSETRRLAVGRTGARPSRIEQDFASFVVERALAD
ncbi:MAG: HNH endonuclease [Actinomycetota bacterium]|nr:HNH endonuclease [Actinomycetota bacterium]